MLKFILIAIVIYLAISIALIISSRKGIFGSVESTIDKIGLFIFCIVTAPIIAIVGIIEVAKEEHKQN